ncbi:MAG: LVIVD repeat-containing protein [Janthinobacterium lividum]|jgi:hypothetical protein
MNKLLRRLPGMALLLGLLTVLACSRQEPQPDDSYLVYASYRPLYMTRTVLESSVASLPPQALRNTGKIFLRGPYIFINEKYEGVHIIDNHDPANPRPISFLRIPGNVDMAVQGNLLYADNGPDLVTVDISNPERAQLASRVRDAFRELPMPEIGPLEDANLPVNRPANTVVIGWRHLAPGEATPTRVTYNRGGILMYANTASSAAVPSSGQGKAGSLARFAILNQYLYTVDEYSLRLFSLQNPTSPIAGKTLGVGFGIETIFPQDHYLFLGSQTGMFIYDVATPTAPTYVSGFSHTRSCDPVVVDGHFAYVTLSKGEERAATRCGPDPSNELDVIDLSNIKQVSLARTYPMSGPQGLGAENNRLYVCDDGLKVFDTSKAPELTQLQHFATPVTDVIPNGDYLLAVGPGGFYQYRTRNSAGSPELSLLSIIPKLL